MKNYRIEKRDHSSTCPPQPTCHRICLFNYRPPGSANNRTVFRLLKPLLPWPDILGAFPVWKANGLLCSIAVRRLERMNDLFFVQLVKKKCQKFFIGCEWTLSSFKKPFDGGFGRRGIPNNPPCFQWRSLSVTGDQLSSLFPRLENKLPALRCSRSPGTSVGPLWGYAEQIRHPGGIRPFPRYSSQNTHNDMLIRYTRDFTEVCMVVLVSLMSRGSFLQAESNKCIRKLVMELLTLGQSEDACIFHFGTNHLTLSFGKYLSFSLCTHEPGLLSSTSKSSLFFFFSLHAAWFHQHLYIIR